MGVLPKPVFIIPEDTFQAARRIYSLQHSYLRIGDQLDRILAAVEIGLLDPSASLPGDTALRLGMVTAFQFAEDLPDLSASEATMRRLDWKYALFLPISHPGISSAALCDFRQSLHSSRSGRQEFGLLFEGLVKAGLSTRLPGIPAGADQIQCEGYILTMVCTINRQHRLSLAMKMALGVLSSTRPDWLRTVLLPHWYERYKSGQLYQSIHSDLGDAMKEVMALGADIRRLLAALQQPDAGELSALPEVRSLAQLWEEQYQQGPDGFSWRMSGCGNCRA